MGAIRASGLASRHRPDRARRVPTALVASSCDGPDLPTPSLRGSGAAARGPCQRQRLPSRLDSWPAWWPSPLSPPPAPAHPAGTLIVASKARIDSLDALRGSPAMGFITSTAQAQRGRIPGIEDQFGFMGRSRAGR